MALTLHQHASLGPGVTDTLLLGIAGFVVNMATTFQDVGRMAVDIMEEEERARASGIMFGGQRDHHHLRADDPDPPPPIARKV